MIPIRRVQLLAIIVTALCFCATTIATEIHSNGVGGGAWSDAATWRTKTVPGPEDTAVITSGDAVVFDRADDAKTIACKDLYIDPDGALTFKSGGKRVLAVEGPIESYGLIKLDASSSADDSMEIRFTGPTAQRSLKLVKGGALLALGRPGLPGKNRNVVIRSKPPVTPPPPGTPPPPAPQPAPPIAEQLSVVEAVTGTTIDLRNAQFDAVTVHASKIDNTGAKANERVNVAECRFAAGASVACDYCDSATIVGNTFDYAGENLTFNAITLNYSPLAEVRANTISGKFSWGVYGYQQVDTSVLGNVIDKCVGGIYWCGTNGMLKGNTVRGATTGCVVTSMSGAMEDATFDGCTTALSVAGATLQAMDVRFSNLPKDGVRVQFGNGAMTLVNCDLTPEQIKTTPGAAVTPTPRVVSMQYCVVGVKGSAPSAAAVDATTANPPAPLAPGAMDLNVRNAPAAILNGLTPLPASLKPLLLKSWAIEGDGKLTPAPQYNLSVVVPELTGSAAKPKQLKTLPVTPQPSWYRPKSNDPAPTVEVTLP